MACGCKSSKSDCSCSCSIKTLDPVAASEPASGKYSVKINVKKGLGGAKLCQVYAGSTSSEDCGGEGQSLEAAIVQALADAILLAIDSSYVAPVVDPLTPVVYGPDPDSVTLEDFIATMVNAANNPTPATGAVAAITCLATAVFVGARAAVRHSLAQSANTSLCGASDSFGSCTDTCKVGLEIKIN